MTGELPTAAPYLYLTTTGRRSGKPHEIEIWYVVYDGCCYLVAELRERADWVLNIQHNPAVTVRLEDRVFAAVGRTVDPAAEPERAAAVCALMDAKYDWSDGLIVELCPRAEQRA